jgi:hypothetical protein
MNTYDNVKASTGSVGDWDGNEQLASDNVNRIYKAIFDSVDDNYDPDSLAQIIHDVWDDWGSDESLLEITDAQIENYVSKKL